MSLQDYPNVSDWLAVRGDQLVVRTGKVDIGQRISTALAGIVHEELTLPYEQIEIAPVRTGDSPDEGMTSGSNSIEQSGYAIRHAAATLNERLRDLVAERMGGAPDEWVLEDGTLTGPGTNRPIPALDLLREIDLAIPVNCDAPLMPHAAPVAQPMRGLAELVTGRYQFLHDLELPNMLHARVVRAPHARARLVALDESVAEKLSVEGLRIHRDGSFIAVAGPREWPVVKGATRLASAGEWDRAGGLPEIDIFDRLTQGNAQRLTVENGSPLKDAPIPEPLSDPNYSVRYERPFTMHGALAPSVAMAVWNGKTLEITTHSQGIYVLRESIAESLDLAVEDVVLTHWPGSGCYGHNGADDAAYEAALLAMALPDTPILLKWTREDEHAWEPYGPASAIEIAARTGEDGTLQAFSAEAIGGTFRGRPRAAPGRVGPAKLIANQFRADPIAPADAMPNMNRQGGLQRNLDPVYDIPELRTVKNLIPDMPLRTSALRCLGATLNVFGIESIVDEIASDAGEDPIAFRKRHLTDPRAIAVLDRLDQALSKLPAPNDASGRGIAYGQYKNEMTRVGVAVDVSIDDRAQVHLTRAVLVADAGRIIDRDGLSAQLEGGFLQGASWALYEKVTWDRDGVTSRDWDSYPVLRFDNLPEIEVILLDQPSAKSVGAGEASPGPAVAAIANAVFDATGLRLRRLPFTPDALTSAALAG